MQTVTMRAPDTEAVAAQWLIRLDADQSAAVRAEFAAWLAADPRNQAVFLRLERFWKHANHLRRLRPLDGLVDADLLSRFSPAPPPEPSPARKRWLVAGSAAACIALVALAFVSWEAAASREYRTDFGGFARIVLSDGSSVWLNTNSELRVRMTPWRREVLLRRGEALFTVAHDAGRPFDVQAQGARVRAVGTAFSVRLNSSAVDVLVREGQIVIDPDESVQGLGVAVPALPRGLPTVDAGERATVERHQVEIRKVASADVTRLLAWTQGRLMFDRTSLATAVTEFNRYNRRQLAIADPSLANVRIGGAFDATDPDSFVAALRTLGIQAFFSSHPSGDPSADVINLTRAPRLP